MSISELINKLGESRHDYIRCLVMAAQNIGIRTVVFNNRGLGDELITEI